MLELKRKKILSFFCYLLIKAQTGCGAQYLSQAKVCATLSHICQLYTCAKIIQCPFWLTHKMPYTIWKRKFQNHWKLNAAHMGKPVVQKTFLINGAKANPNTSTNVSNKTVWASMAHEMQNVSEDPFLLKDSMQQKVAFNKYVKFGCHSKVGGTRFLCIVSRGGSLMRSVLRLLFGRNVWEAS